MTSATSVIGYAADADHWCPPCAAKFYGGPGGVMEYENTTIVDRGGNEVSPIFGGAEFDYVPTCSGCKQTLDGYQLTDYGQQELDAYDEKRRTEAAKQLRSYAEALRDIDMADLDSVADLEEARDAVEQNTRLPALLLEMLDTYKRNEIDLA